MGISSYGKDEPAPPERFVYLLDHEYTQRGLAWNHLKNGDGARVAALRAAAGRLDCECFLSLAEVHETWLCEDDYPRGRYGRRGFRFDEDDYESASDEYELIELQDSNIDLNHWLDVDGKHVEGIPGAARDDELHLTKPFRDIDPFKSEHEGYQGNYGNTVDRWYHRAAFVMWPRANGFTLRAQASPQWAVGELLALPRASTTELESRVRSLLPRWRRTAGSVEGLQFFANLVKLSARIEDAALAREWLAPLGLHRLTSKQMRRGLAALIDKHGVPWAKQLLTEWEKHQHWGTPVYAPLLADLCADLQASNSKANEALASWLLEREVKAALDRCVTAFERHPPWLDSAKLPVLHTTLRRGSPHVLQLRKDGSLVSRERTYRARVKEIFDALPAARSA